jgi:hydroquinone glucosyltransferase
MQLQIPKFIAEGLLPLPTSTKDGPINIPGLPPFSAFDLPRDLICDESSPNYKFYTRNTLRLGDATCILVNTFYELEKNVFDVVESEILNSTMQVRKIVPIGPLLPAEHHLRVEDRHPAEKWLDNQKKDSVLYVAFGSAIVFSPAQILELTEGLESSGQPFVLVLQLPNGEALDKLSPGFEERTKDRGIVVTDWAPQVRILNHPATGAFMTHCGWNSALESISMGVPLIAWPMMAEQKMNCRFLVDIAKLAIEVQIGKEGFVEKEEVTRVVRLLMQKSLGSDIHKHARKMQELAHEAMAPGGSSQKNLDDYVKELAVSKHKE